MSLLSFRALFLFVWRLAAVGLCLFVPVGSLDSFPCFQGKHLRVGDCNDCPGTESDFHGAIRGGPASLLFRRARGGLLYPVRFGFVVGLASCPGNPGRDHLEIVG